VPGLCHCPCQHTALLQRTLAYLLISIFSIGSHQCRCKSTCNHMVCKCRGRYTQRPTRQVSTSASPAVRTQVCHMISALLVAKARACCFKNRAGHLQVSAARTRHRKKGPTAIRTRGRRTMSTANKYRMSAAVLSVRSLLLWCLASCIETYQRPAVALDPR
jgi:hypothetical protein